MEGKWHVGSFTSLITRRATFHRRKVFFKLWMSALPAQNAQFHIFREDPSLPLSALHSFRVKGEIPVLYISNTSPRLYFIFLSSDGMNGGRVLKVSRVGGRKLYLVCAGWPHSPADPASPWSGQCPLFCRLPTFSPLRAWALWCRCWRCN